MSEITDRLLSFAATLANNEEDLLVEAAKRIRELEQRKTRDMADLIQILTDRDTSIEHLEQQLKAAQDAASYMHRSYHAIIDGECSYCEYFGPTREFRGEE